MEMPWTSPQDVLERWLGQGVKPTLLEDEDLLETLIGDAEDEIIRLIPSVPARLDSGELPLRRVHRVVAAVIQRAWQIAGEYRTYASEGVGPFMASSSFSSQLRRELALTGEEISILSPPSTNTVRMAGMLNGSRGRNVMWPSRNDPFKMHRRVAPQGQVYYSNVPPSVDCE